MSHAKGPWSRVDYTTGYKIRDVEGYVIAFIHWSPFWSDEENQAHASLLTKAWLIPEIEAELERIVSIQREDGEYDKHDMAGAIVIAKELLAKLSIQKEE